jgi:hypothetical protein
MATVVQEICGSWLRHQPSHRGQHCRRGRFVSCTVFACFEGMKPYDCVHLARTDLMGRFVHRLVGRPDPADPSNTLRASVNNVVPK